MNVLEFSDRMIPYEEFADDLAARIANMIQSTMMTLNTQSKTRPGDYLADVMLNAGGKKGRLSRANDQVS